HQKAPSAAGDHGHGEVPRVLVDVVRRCLQKSADDRFDDAETLRAALLDAVELPPDADRTQTIAAPQDDGLSRRFVRQALRLKASRTAALVAGTTLGLAAGCWLALPLRRDPLSLHPTPIATRLSQSHPARIRMRLAILCLLCAAACTTNAVNDVDIPSPDLSA